MTLGVSPDVDARYRAIVDAGLLLLSDSQWPQSSDITRTETVGETGLTGSSELNSFALDAERVAPAGTATAALSGNQNDRQGRDADAAFENFQGIHAQMDALRRELRMSAGEMAEEVCNLVGRQALSGTTLRGNMPSSSSSRAASPQQPRSGACEGTSSPPRGPQRSSSASPVPMRPPPHSCGQSSENDSSLQDAGRRCMRERLDKLREREADLVFLEKELRAREARLTERERETESAARVNDAAVNREPPRSMGPLPEDTYECEEVRNAMTSGASLRALLDLARQRGQAEMSKSLRACESARQDLERQVGQLREAIEQRDFELASRPEHRTVQQLRNRITDLEKRLDPEQEALRRIADTRELIRRDRQRHTADRARTSSRERPCDTVPAPSSMADSARNAMHSSSSRKLLHARLSKCRREDLELALIDACESVGVTSLEQLGIASKQLASVVRLHVPRLQDFVASILEIVLGAESHTPLGATSKTDDLSSVLEKLRSWKTLAGTQSSNFVKPTVFATEFRTDDLLEADKRVAARLELLQQQKGARQPASSQELSQLIVRQFMKVFDVASIDGCIPAMSVLATRLSEQKSLLRAACELLRQRPEETSLAAAARGLSRLAGRH